MPHPTTLAWIELLLDPDLDGNQPAPDAAHVTAVLDAIDAGVRAAATATPGPHDADVLRHLFTVRWIRTELSRVAAGWAYGDTMVPREDSSSAPQIRALHGQLRARRLEVWRSQNERRTRDRNVWQEFEEEWRAERREMRLLAIEEFADVADRLVKRCKLTPMLPRQLFEYVRTFLYEPRAYGGEPGAYVKLLRARLADDSGRLEDLPPGVDVLGLDDFDPGCPPPPSLSPNFTPGAAIATVLDRYERWLAVPDRQLTERQAFGARLWLVYLHARFDQRGRLDPPVRMTLTDAAYSAVREDRAHDMERVVKVWQTVAPALADGNARAELRRALGHEDDVAEPRRAALPFPPVLVHAVNERRRSGAGPGMPKTAEAAKALRNDVQTNHVRAIKGIWFDFARSLRDEPQLILTAAALFDNADDTEGADR